FSSLHTTRSTRRFFFHLIRFSLSLVYFHSFFLCLIHSFFLKHHLFLSADMLETLSKALLSFLISSYC
ncbi:hypothetical protein PENTCL1PPCAC_19877, partial [Pristionchus entomophagus]